MGFTGVAPPRAPAGGLPQDKFKDPVAYFQHREAAVAEEFVHVAEAKVRDSGPPPQMRRARSLRGAA
jgi:hypothetical protein